MGFSYNVNVLNQKGSPALYTDIFANRPAAGYQGRLFISTDTAAIYEDTGTAWTLIANVSSGAGTLQQVTTNGNTSNVGISVTAGGVSTNSLTDTSLTTGSVPFAGAGGLISQDNANLFWDNTNNRLGINTNTPGNSLDVHTAGTNPTIALNNTAGNQSAVSFLKTSVAKWRIGNTATDTFDIHNFALSLIAMSIDGTTNSASFTADLLIVNTATNIRIYLTNNTTTTGKSWYLNSKSDGKFYLGNVTAGDLLNFDVTGEASFQNKITAVGTIFSNSSTVSNFTLGSSGGNFGQIFSNGANAWSLGYGSAAGTIGTPVLNWTNGGAVLIGTTSSTGVDKVRVNNDGAAAYSTVNITNANSTAVLYVGVGGSGVADASLQNNAYILNTGATSLLLGTNGTQRLIITSTGVITIANLSGTGSRAVLADANGNLSAPVSDQSVKKNIEPLKYGLETIMKLNAVQFEFIEEYKNYGEGLQIGAIAQEVEEIIPEAVFKTPSTNLKGIDYNQFNGIYIKAIQDQQKIIENLIERIEALENK